MEEGGRHGGTKRGKEGGEEGRREGTRAKPGNQLVHIYLYPLVRPTFMPRQSVISIHNTKCLINY